MLLPSLLQLHDLSRAELKVTGAGPSRYPRAEAGSSSKQVDRRARGLPTDYK